jgi:hypothetical protein
MLLVDTSSLVQISQGKTHAVRLVPLDSIMIRKECALIAKLVVSRVQDLEELLETVSLAVKKMAISMIRLEIAGTLFAEMEGGLDWMKSAMMAIVNLTTVALSRAK